MVIHQVLQQHDAAICILETRKLFDAVLALWGLNSCGGDHHDHRGAAKLSWLRKCEIDD